MAVGGSIDAFTSSPRWGTALDWAVILTVVLAVLIVAAVVAARIVYRGRQTEGSALWLHLIALGIFPLFLLACGTFATLEYAKETQFCAACHLTMKPYIDDLRAPKGTSLAALHFQHRFAPGTECYACHVDYGLHGTFEAKLAGLKDTYRYVTRTYRLPLAMTAPFDNGLCLKCHDGAKRFIADDVHLDGDRVSKELRTGATLCGDCHKAAHKMPVRRAAPPRGAS